MSPDVTVDQGSRVVRAKHVLRCGFWVAVMLLSCLGIVTSRTWFSVGISVLTLRCGYWGLAGELRALGQGETA